MPEQSQRVTADAILHDMTSIIDRLDEAGLTLVAARMSMAIDAYKDERRPEGYKWRKLGAQTGECG